MPNLDHRLLRRLAAWDTAGARVYSLYLNVDGRRSPRARDYLARAQELCRRMGERATAHAREDAPGGAIRHDTGRIMLYLEREFERGAVRGVAIFSCAPAGLWEVVRTWRPLADGYAVAEQPYLLPLEVMLETYESFCTVLIDRGRARIFRAELGRLEEEREVLDEVPKHHEQGGRAQARLQRHASEVGERHFRHTADVVLEVFGRRAFDHLILAGSEDVLPEFERLLHDYLRRRVVARETLAMTATTDEVLSRSLAVEERLEADRERRTVERLVADAAAGRAAVTGLNRTLSALGDGRVRTLVVRADYRHPGVRCTRCGRLAADEGVCSTCGGPMDRVADVIESAVGAALRQGAKVEPIAADRIAPDPNGGGNGDAADRSGGPRVEIGALLRF
jgi:peptide chain release factor subunit 1